MSASETMARIRHEAIIGIIRADNAESAVEHGQRLIRLGVSVIEVSLTTPGALVAIETLSTNDEVLVGVGTSLDESSTQRAIDAGAKFALAPSAAPAMVATALRYGVAAIPAAFTPSEAVAAMERGASAVKLFPAKVIGPSGLAAIAEALPQIPFVATGGVSLDNAHEWLGAGAIALGMGGGLLSAEASEVERLIHAIAASR